MLGLLGGRGFVPIVRGAGVLVLQGGGVPVPVRVEEGFPQDVEAVVEALAGRRSRVAVAGPGAALAGQGAAVFGGVLIVITEARPVRSSAATVPDMAARLQCEQILHHFER